MSPVSKRHRIPGKRAPAQQARWSGSQAESCSPRSSLHLLLPVPPRALKLRGRVPSLVAPHPRLPLRRARPPRRAETAAAAGQGKGGRPSASGRSVAEAASLVRAGLSEET